MKKILFLNLLVIVLFSTVPVAAMEPEYVQQIQQAEINNNTSCVLTTLPTEILIGTFSYCHEQNCHDGSQELEGLIKNCMKLSSVCKKFNRLLSIKDTIVELYKNYDLEDKNECLQFRVNSMYTLESEKKLLVPIAILIASGAQLKVSTFPKTVEMTQIFIDSGDIHDMSKWCNDSLWRIAGDALYSPKLLAFYLTQNVNARGLACCSKACLLHSLTQNRSFSSGGKDCLEKARILFDVIPDMINHQNEEGKTPLDYVYEDLKEAKRINDAPHVAEQLIAMYRQCGGLTSQELDARKQKQSQENAQSTCHLF